MWQFYITNSLNQFLSHYGLIILVGIVVLLIDSFLKQTKIKLRSDYEKKYQSIDEKIQDDSIFSELYKKLYHLDVIRIGIFLISFSLILFYTNPGSFGFIFVSIGGLIVALREYLLSFITFFYLNSLYKVGDIILLKNKDIQGEIVYIRPLYIGLVTKDQNGDNQGEFVSFLNSKFVDEYVIKVDLKLTSNKLYSFKITYDPDLYNVGFESFLSTILMHLDVSLPKKKSDDIPNYKSFIGYKYKYDLELLEDSRINILISLISLKHTVRQLKYEIYLILERFASAKEESVEEKLIYK